MTEFNMIRCAWCGELVAPSTGPGRPRRYCRPSHRQRHYEARRQARLRRLGDDEVLFSAEDVGRLGDAIHILEAAVQDARMDLAEAASLEAYPQAFRNVTKAADGISASHLKPRASTR